MNETKIYQASEFTDAYVIDTIKEVSKSLEEKGYDSVNQIVGYLISGDPGYISSYKDARNKIQEVDRSKIVEILLGDFRKNNK